MRVGGRFAGEVAGIELRDGGVDVVEVERDPGLDPVVGVDLDYPQEICAERPRILDIVRVSGTREGEAFSAGGNRV